MRSLIASLLLLNLAFFLWRYQFPVEPPRRPPELSAVPLMLLQEQQQAPVAPVLGSAPCYTVGPFDNAEQLSAFSERFSLAGTSRVLEEDSPYGFRVYLPPYPDRQQALSAASQLAEQGVEDYYIMSSGRMEHAISLGLFREQRHAIRHLERLRNKGIGLLQIAPHYKKQRVFWLDFSQALESWSRLEKVLLDEGLRLLHCR